MNEISIAGKSYSEEEIKRIGQTSLKKTKLGRLIHGIIWGVFGLSVVITGISNCASGSISAGMPLIFIFLPPFIIGLVLFIKSFFVKGNPYDEGIKVLNKRNGGLNEKIENADKVERLSSDKEMVLSSNPMFKFMIDSSTMRFQILQGTMLTKIYDAKDLLTYEIRVDNELVVDSQTQSKKGVGKSVAMGLAGKALFGNGGAGMMAGAMGASQKTNSKSTSKEIHHYTLVLKVNDIIHPSYVCELASIEMAEEIAGTLSIIDNAKKDAKEESVEVEETKSEEKQTNLDTTDIEKLKKYKDLYDSGVITKEQFEKKRDELLGL